MSFIAKNISTAIDGKQILKDVSLTLQPGKIHAIMGPNGSGKSTFAQVLIGNELYKTDFGKGTVLTLDGIDIRNKPSDERSRMGLFLAFQSPVVIPGVTAANLLKIAYGLRFPSKNSKTKHNAALSVMEFNTLLVRRAKALGIKKEFLGRAIHEGFSGGERKKMEMLQATILKPKYAIFDEIDTGLDVDALRIVASEMVELKKNGTGVLVITHYQRILRFAPADTVHIMVNGTIVESGNKSLALTVEKEGYKKWTGN